MDIEWKKKEKYTRKDVKEGGEGETVMSDE